LSNFERGKLLFTIKSTFLPHPEIILPAKWESEPKRTNKKLYLAYFPTILGILTLNYGRRKISLTKFISSYIMRNERGIYNAVANHAVFDIKKE
jgi:hypothetical protein